MSEQLRAALLRIFDAAVDRPDIREVARAALAAAPSTPEPGIDVELDAEDWAAIENCVAACANDPREPERYREWYQSVLTKIRARLASKDR